MATDLPTIKPVLTMWQTAIFAGVVTADHWVPWADDVILRMRHSPMWVLMMSVSGDRDALEQNLKGAYQEFDLPHDEHPFYPFYMGYRVNMLCGGQISAKQMLEDRWIHPEDHSFALEYFLPTFFDEWHKDVCEEEELWEIAYRLGATDAQITRAFAYIFSDRARDAAEALDWLINYSADYLVRMGDDPRLAHVIDGVG